MASTKFLVAAARFTRELESEAATEPAWDRRELLILKSVPRVVAPFDAVLSTDNEFARHGPYGVASDRHGHERRATGRECFHISDVRVDALRAQLTADAVLCRPT
ncbi:3'-N-debenzoyl-2'-deoxytaxol N-benzoyltransferase [Hordeum vulgare]|nr:3'-N-debenzoyl-2'-deoxytaxol N-benzoyltransferase [Hordeum vulgare]